MPKTDAQRNAALRERRKALGLKRVEVWCHPDFAPLVKNYVAEHIRMREAITTFEPVVIKIKETV
jgi:hypothetical protein